MEKFDRITFNPQIMGGRACIRGMRIPVASIVNQLAEGIPEEQILTEFPYLDAEDIKQALQYAAGLTEERVYAG
jgi:uncharacterized protein (DUF433 family)